MALKIFEKFGFSKLTCIGFLLLVSCGDPGDQTLQTQSHTMSDVNKDYGFEYSVPLSCGTKFNEELTSSTLRSVQMFSDFCELQNKESAKNGYLRCPTGLCQTENKPGGVTTPTATISINNGTSSGGSSFGGFGGGTGFGGAGGGGIIGGGGLSDKTPVFGKRVYVSLSLTLALARNPDQLTCVNPLRPDAINLVLKTVIEKTAKDCADQ